MAQQRQQQRQQRQNKQKQKNNPRGGNKGANKGKPKNPFAEPLTAKTAAKEVRASTQQKFRPLERAIGSEIRASKQRTAQEGNWWQNYLDEVKGVQGQTQAAYDQAAATTQGFINQAGATDAAQTAKLQTEANANAALRGAAPSTEAANTEAAAGSQRRYLSADYGAKNAAEGASQQAYLADKRRIGVGQSIASRKEEQRRTRGFEKDRRDTRGERGNYATEKRGELRDKEREYLIQRSAFPQKKEELAQQERESAADNRIAQQNANSSTRSSKASAKNANTTAKTAGETGGRTPAEVNVAKEGRSGAVAAARNLIQANGVPKTAKEWAGLQALLEDKAEITPNEARFAIQKLKGKYVGMEATPAGR